MGINRNRFVCAGAMCSVLLLGSGCGFDPFADPRVTDGGGGNILTAGSKILGSQLSSLTQDELQILSDEVNKTIASVVGGDAELPQLTNDQADAVLDLLKANEVDSIEDIVALVETAAEDPSSVVLPESLIEAFTEGDDAVGADDLDDIFNRVFSGIS